MAMNKLLSQTQCLPQSTPATPTCGHFLFSSLHKQPVPDTLNHTPVPSVTQAQNPPSAPLLSTSHRANMAVPVALSTPGTTTVSQIPTSLQRLVQANLSANPCGQPTSSYSSPLSQSLISGDSTSPTQRYSPSSCSPSPSRANTTATNSRPVPLSITPSTGPTTSSSDEVEPTPLTPLSPYCGQQGIYYTLMWIVHEMLCRHIVCLFLGKGRWLSLFFQF